MNVDATILPPHVTYPPEPRPSSCYRCWNDELPLPGKIAACFLIGIALFSITTTVALVAVGTVTAARLEARADHIFRRQDELDSRLRLTLATQFETTYARISILGDLMEEVGSLVGDLGDLTVEATNHQLIQSERLRYAIVLLVNTMQNATIRVRALPPALQMQLAPPTPLHLPNATRRRARWPRLNQ